MPATATVHIVTCIAASITGPRNTHPHSKRLSAYTICGSHRISAAPAPSNLQVSMPLNQQCSDMLPIYTHIPYQSTLGSLSILIKTI